MERGGLLRSDASDEKRVAREESAAAKVVDVVYELTCSLWCSTILLRQISQGAGRRTHICSPASFLTSLRNSFRVARDDVG